MVIVLLKELKDYLYYVEKYTNWRLHIHQVEKLAGIYCSALYDYSNHSNPYCSYIKTNKELYQFCLNRKASLINKNPQSVFYTICHAGVGEYIVPVYHLGKAVGYISVGAFRKPLEQSHQNIQNLCSKYGLVIEALNDYYENSLSYHLPDIKAVTAIITPAARLLEMIYNELIRIEKIPSYKSSTEEMVYKKALDFIREYYRTKITLKQISEFCNYSESYVSHMFKKKNGLSIHNYTNKYRINKAKFLITTTSSSLKNIAFDVGFTDYCYFSSIFKRHINMSPKEYRKSQTSLKDPSS